jgi:hypothetical protein
MIWARTRVLLQQTLVLSLSLYSSSLPSCLVFFPSTLICFLLRHHPTPLFAAWKYKSLPPVPPESRVTTSTARPCSYGLGTCTSKPPWSLCFCRRFAPK